MKYVRGVEVQRWDRAYRARLRLTDFLIVTAAVFGAVIVRFGGLDESAIQGTLSGWQYGHVGVALLLLVGWNFLLSTFASRDAKIVGAGSAEYARVVQATFSLYGALAILAYLFQIDIARGYFLISLPIGGVGLLLGRWAWRQWLIRKRQVGQLSEQVLLIGTRSKAEHIAADIAREPGAGLKLIGVLLPADEPARHAVASVPVLGTFEDISRVLSEHAVTAIVLTGSDRLDHDHVRVLGWDLEARGVKLMVNPALTDIAGPRIHASPIANVPLIQVDFPVMEGRRYLAKRASDIAVAGMGLLVLLPLFVLVGIIVKIDSTGPVFFRQERVGLNGRPFMMYKFRSMAIDAESRLAALKSSSDGNGVLFKMKDDPRITRSGRWLRRFSLDELPQLVNVLNGTMSLVGPRPPLAAEVALYDEAALRRLRVKPGITGLWQVSGRSHLSWEDSIRLDLYYVENWSLTGDAVILWRTVRAVALAEGSY